MARIRTIKPEMWTDEAFVECSSNARLLFVAGLNFATDHGVLPCSARQLKMQCFPGDNLDVWPLIVELVDAGLWVPATAPDGTEVLLIRSFSQHQRIDKPHPKPKWGDPAEWDSGSVHGVLPEDSSSARRTVDERSTPKGMEGKGMEGKGSTRATSRRTTDPRIVDAFDRMWDVWPKRDGSDRKGHKTKARAAFLRAVESRDGDLTELETALTNYLNAVAAGRSPKDCDRFWAMTEWTDWIDVDTGPVAPRNGQSSVYEQRTRQLMARAKQMEQQEDLW